jgi:hypothetical protein
MSTQVCGYIWKASSGDVSCVRAKGHRGLHRSAEGETKLQGKTQTSKAQTGEKAAEGQS